VSNDETKLKVVSIRLPEDLIEQLKLIADDTGLKYQPYVRMILTQHIKAKQVRIATHEEFKKALNRVMNDPATRTTSEYLKDK
jgi:antitoxin component of RelBE/YafQ-DinJ toxin-antitoxin module